MSKSWDDLWMEVALVVASKSGCTNRQVGAVVVDANNRIVATGYNGAPAGFLKSGPCSGFCPRSVVNDGLRKEEYDNCVSVHAENNALIFADRSRVEGGTMFVTSPCCFSCAKVVANSGVAKLVVRASGHDQHSDWLRGVEFIRSCGIIVEVKRGS